MSEYGWRPSHSVEAPGQLDRIPEFDPRSGEHCWIEIVAYRVFPERWSKDQLPVLDQENLVSIQGPGCFYCEEPYTERLAKRRCPGGPRS